MSQENKPPLISVILPVYNAEKYIKESVFSVLNQTFKDFELIIINDGSTDKSGEVIKSIIDERIIYVEQKNMGLPATLNVGIKMARAEIIARQDNDDISLPQRFEKQLKFLKENPKVALLGTRAIIINESGKRIGKNLDHPTDKIELKFALLFNNPFAHSSVFFRKAILEKTGNYHTGIEVFEDFNLWSRIAQVAEVANLEEHLLLYREVSSSMSRTTSDYHQRVINQSVKNIKYYCENIDEKKITKFVNYVLEVEKYKNFNEAYSLVKGVMRVVSKNISKKENLPLTGFQREAKKQILNFKRAHYNKIISNDKTGALAKIKAKTLRKIMFIWRKKLLE